MADLYKPHVSGVTNYIALNKRFLEKAGHEVFVFTFGTSALAKHDKEANVIRSPGVRVVDTGFFFGMGYTPSAKALLQTMDLVHVHHPFLSGRLALRYCKPIHIPIVFTNHTRYDLYLQSYFPILPEGLGKTIMEAFFPSFCRSVDLVISPSPGMQAVLQRLGVDIPIKVIPNGVDLGLFKHNTPGRNRVEFGFKAEDVILVYMGRIAPEKNLDFLLRAFARVASADARIQLLVIGGGPYLPSLKELAGKLKIEGRVVFTGLVRNDEIPAYLSACDLFVTASVTEVHPLSIIEAMAVGLPVLGIDSPGVSDTIRDGITGFISSNDLEVFTQKMVYLSGDMDLRQQMRQAALQEVEQYDIERTVQLILAQYKRLLVLEPQPLQDNRFEIRNRAEK